MGDETASGSGSSGSGLTKSRIETLCDGVFAIAMTLLIFNIKVPSLSPPPAGSSLTRALFGLWPQFLVYAISFIMLGVYWVGHHNQFHYIRRTDRVLLWVNVLFLMFVALVPFSTALLGEYPAEQVAVVFYAVNLMLVGLTLYAQWWYATSGHHLVDADLDLVLVRLAKRRVLMGPVILLVAVAGSFVSTKVSILIYALIPVFYILPGRIDRHWLPNRRPHLHSTAHRD